MILFWVCLFLSKWNGDVLQGGGACILFNWIRGKNASSIDTSQASHVCRGESDVHCLFFTFYLCYVFVVFSCVFFICCSLQYSTRSMPINLKELLCWTLSLVILWGFSSQFSTCTVKEPESEYDLIKWNVL